MAKLQRTLMDSLKFDPRFSPQNSQRWFAAKIKELSGKPKITSLQMLAMHQQKLVTSVMPGNMYFFVYDPKNKEKMTTWDKFPLVLPFNKDHNSFIGLNLHYLPPAKRIKLLSDLMEVAQNNRYGQPDKLRLSWAYLNNVSKFPQVSMCVKRYLAGHVKSRFLKVDAEDWMMSAMLPTENFAKGKPY